VLAPRVLDLNDVVRSVTDMLERLIGEDVRLLVLPARELWRTRLDASQLEQVLMNLVVNARDAMPQGGELTIETRNIDGSLEGSRLPTELGAEQWVLLSVRDTGVGMAPQTAARAFEPFYTTKHQSRGTGLGLSTVYGIVKQSGGHICFDSAPGQGTTFSIYLPRTLDRESSEPDERAPASAPGHETILLVEDDDQVRQVASEILRLNGYRVLIAGSPREALALGADLAERIELLVTDVVMPELSGKQLAERLRQARPDLRVLYMSGYADRSFEAEGSLAGAAFLQKPVTPDLLTGLVRGLLDTPRR
jgi:CheY-like chemotaxis protein